MRKNSTKWLAVILFVLAGFAVKAQTFTVTNEADLIAAINSLNTSGVVSGGATVTFTANVSLTAALPTLGSAALNATTTASDPLIIDGAGFSVTANYAGTRTGSLTTGANDALLAIAGTDYVTVQNLTFAEQAGNTSTAAMIENAIGVYNRSATTPFDGVQYLTVTGCTFNMNKVTANPLATTIHMTNYVSAGTSSLAWASFATDPTQMHREITISNNTFNGSYNHIIWNNGSSNNGRNLTVSGNTFNNYGGGAGTAYGVYAATRLDGFNVQNNTFSSSATQSSANYAVYAATNCGGQQIVTGNTTLLQNAVTTSTTYNIYLTSIGANTQIENNTLTFGTWSAITSGAIYCFYTTNSGGVTGHTAYVRNNHIDNQTLPATTGTFYGFYGGGLTTTGTNSTVRISENTFTNNTKSNSGTLYVVFQTSAVNTIDSANVISNFTVTNNSASGVSTIYAIYGSNSTPTSAKFLNNTISNINVYGTSTSTTGTIRGIYSFPVGTGTAQEISGNTVTNLAYLGTTSGTIYGIYNATGSTVPINNNVISGLKTVNAGTVYGIYCQGAVTHNVYNNCISDLTAPSGATTTAVTGIYIATGTTVNASYNTIYLSSVNPLTSTATNFGVTGIYQTTTVALNLKNNIINITGTPMGTGTIACVRRSATGTAGTKPANLNPSNNIYYVSAGPQNYIYVEGTAVGAGTLKNGYALSGLTADPTNNIVNDPAFNTGCGLYKLFMLENGTFSEDNLVANGSCFAPTGGSFAEGNATTSTTPTIATDLANVTRAATPDMGALEFTGTATDAVAPSITFTNIPNTICTTDAIFSATITDAAGINVTAGTAPRLWFKKSTENNAYNGNTVADNGWKYVEALNTTSPFQFSMSLSLLNSAAAAGDVIQYFVTAQDLAATPNVAVNLAAFPSGFCPLTVALDPAAYPVSGAVKSFTILPDPVTVTSVASNTSLCLTGNTVLSLTGDASTGAFYQWQSSLNGTTWSDIAGATTATYTYNGLTATTYFRCEISCGDLVANGGTPITINNSTPVTVTVSSPAITGTTPGSRCGIGTVTLSATANAGSDLYWYSAPTGGSAIGTGNSFTTPSISTSTDFYVSASQGGQSGLTLPGDGNWNHFTTSGAFQTSTITGAYVILTVLTPLTLTSVDMYPSAAVGTAFSLDCRTGSASGTSFASYSGTTTVQNVTTPTVAQTVPVNWVLPVGTYYIGFISNPNTWRSGLATHTYPWTLPGVASRTDYLTPSYQYYLYNMQFSTGCESARTAVNAAVVAPPTISIAGTSSVECSDAIVPLSKSTVNPTDYDTYIWSPTTNLYTDPSCLPAFAYTGTSEAQVWFKSSTAGANNYTLTASNSVSGCSNIATGTTTVLPASVSVVSSSEICISGSKTISLLPITGLSASNVQWKENGVDISGANSLTYTTPTLTTTTPYSVDLLDGNGNVCYTSPNTSVVVNNPALISTTGATRCGLGPVTLSATANSGSIIRWYSAASGGNELNSIPYTNIPVTGFNNDIVANGVGSNSILGVTNSFGADGQGYHFIDNTFKYVSTNALPTCYMPTNNLAASTRTPGLTYEFQSYTSNNALSISNASTTYTNPIPSSGTLTLTTPASYGVLKVLYESVVTVGSLTVDATVTFTDATTQVFTGNQCVNWFTAAGSAFGNVGRTTPTGTIQCAAQPNFFELSLPISIANQTKQVQSITFSIPTVLTSGTTPASVNYFHAMAVGGQAPSNGTYTTPTISSTTTYYAAASTNTPPGIGGRQAVTTVGSALSAVPRGVQITASQSLNINQIGLMCTGIATDVTVELYNAAGTTSLYSTVVNIPANAGTSTTPVLVTVPVNIQIPSAGTYRLMATTITGASSLYYEYTGVTGFPYNVGTQLTIDGSVTSLTATVTTASNYYFYLLGVDGCESPRQAVTATVTTPPTVTISPNAAICQGFSTALSATSVNDPNYEYTWTPGALVGGTQTVSPAATTVYTVNAVDNVTGCATVGTTTVTVNQNPTAVSIANTTPAGCPGTAATLTATGGTIGGLYTLGTGTTTTVASGGIPYNSNWEGNHTQYLLTVAELNALGMVGGNINSIAFDVSAVGGGNYVPQSGYTIKLGHTSATALSGYVTPTGSFTTCYGPLALPQPVLGWNTMTFTTPFTWDGVSNIVIDICHDNDPTGTCTPVAPALNCYSASSTVRYTATTGTNTVYGSYGDNAAACGVTSVTTITANVNRPNMRFNSATPTTLTWLPNTALSTSTGAITVASPLTTTDYTVTATSTDGCTATSSTTVTVLNCSSTLNLTLFLQGYYIGSNTMAEVMANQGYLPSPAVGDCDDITVELHDAVTTTTVAGTATARLHADGTASASFTPGVTGNYYIVIKHRNSLQTWSTDPVTLATTSSYNFTTAAAQAYADQLVEVEPGVWAIYTGDLNQDDYIDSFDFPIFDLDATNGVSGVYVATDMNGDGYVDPFDFPVFDINSFNGVTATYP